MGEIFFTQPLSHGESALYEKSCVYIIIQNMGPGQNKSAMLSHYS
jgi:hypothetical protein